MAYDEIFHEHEKQIDDQEARRQAIERSKDPTRRRDSDPKPTPYRYGSLLCGGSNTHSSTSTGVALSQDPFEGTSIGARATYMAPGSPLSTTVPVMGELGNNSGWSGAAGVGSGIYTFGGPDVARDPINPSTPSISTIASGSIHTVGSAPTLESDSGRSADLDYLQTDGSSDEFIEVDITGSRVISPPPQLSMSFGSWNTNSSDGRGSGGSKQSGAVDPRDEGPGCEDGQRNLLCPGKQQQQHQRDTMESNTTTTLVQVETVQEVTTEIYPRKRSGSPVSWAAPARGTLFIVNQRDSEDL